MRDNIIHPQTHKPCLLSGQCATCVLLPGNQADIRPGRLRELIEGNTGPSATGLICHETIDYGDSQPGLQPALCRGFYEKFGHLANYIRISERLGGFTEISPPRPAADNRRT
jgi:hypothetical protein